MSSEPMELAVNWNERNANRVLPAYAQPKYDGVPLTFIRRSGDLVVALTRQNTECQSVPHLLEAASLIITKVGGSFTAECLVPGLSFKDSSGIIRRKDPDAETARVIGLVFDANLMCNARETYHIRIKQILHVLAALNAQNNIIGTPKVFLAVPMFTVQDIRGVLSAFELYNGRIKNLEGMMLHSMAKPWKPGTRAIGMSRYKPQPTIDLEVVSFEEAISEAGDGLGMIGRVNVRLRRRLPDGTVRESIVGIGPGKLTHKEREDWWTGRLPGMTPSTCPIKNVRSAPDQLFAEIKYMPDAAYDALRQPTVQRFRTDKTEGDILEYS